MNKSGFVYIMINKNRTTLYIGVSNDLCRRIYEHKNHFIKNSFTDKYNIEYCIYYEEFPSMMTPHLVPASLSFRAKQETSLSKMINQNNISTT